MNLFLKPKIIIITFFITLFSIGLNIYKDYGISWDEQVSRNNGLVAGNYIAKNFLSEEIYSRILNNTFNKKFSDKKIDDIPDFYNRHDRAYGVTFDLPLAFLEYLFPIKNHHIFDIRHLLNHFFFLFALFFFYKAIHLKTNNYIIGLISVLLIYINPRIFAHSFFNSKDLFFLSVFLIGYYSGYLFLKKPVLKNIIFFSAISGFLTATKIYGLTIIFLFIYLFLFKKILYEKFNFLNDAKVVSKILFFWIIFTYIFWPFLWENPINNFIDAFKFMSNHVWFGKVLFFGERIPSNNLPWYYVPIWIIITTPTIYLSIFLISIIFFIIFLFKKKITNKENYIYFESIILILYLIFPIIFASLKNSTIYDGWRHFYFIYPILILVFSNFIFLIKKGFFYNLIICGLFLNFLFISIIMIKNHPNQQIYFNDILEKNIIKQFEKDYWAVSNKILIDKVVEQSINKDKIYYDFRGSPLKFLHIRFLEPNLKKKFIHIKDIENFKGEYYMFVLSRWGLNLRNFYKDKKDIVFEVKFDDIPVNGVYKNFID